MQWQFIICVQTYADVSEQLGVYQLLSLLSCKNEGMDYENISRSFFLSCPTHPPLITFETVVRLLLNSAWRPCH
jgi:hypothetical protein